jgi:hypothetical protein
MEAICSSQTSADFQRTTLRYIPEDSALSSLFFFNRHGGLEQVECLHLWDKETPRDIVVILYLCNVYVGADSKG